MDFLHNKNEEGGIKNVDRKILYYEYEQVLLGKKTSMPSYYFKYTDDNSENHALCIIRYAVENYLRWTPEQLKNNFTKEIAAQLKLESLIKYVHFPPELDPERDYFYIAYAIYPERLKLDLKTLVLTTYKNVLNGDLAKFPKQYLSGTQGMMRACICFQYMISQYFVFNDVKEMYHFFSTSAASKALKQYRLNNICNEMFEHPIDYLHESLPNVQKDEFWYHYYRFKLFRGMQKKRMKNARLAQKKFEKENFDGESWNDEILAEKE